MSRPNAQSMKPATAAKKLDVYLQATPAEFQENAITRAELAALQEDPPQWLKDLRKNGPHPKNLVAAKLGRRPRSPCAVLPAIRRGSRGH
ncbi:Uncharacterised protein [Mycobacteroides abscessus]|nr:Uncharacterised protein [Mycobacteroides abscessus]